jgi:hypothetical protein
MKDFIKTMNELRERGQNKTPEPSFDDPQI